MNAREVIPLAIAPAAGFLDGWIVHMDEKRDAAPPPTGQTAPKGISAKQYQTAYRLGLLGGGIALALMGKDIVGMTLLSCGVAGMSKEGVELT